MTLWNEKRRILITCARGTPGILSGELQALRLPVRAMQETALETEGSLADTVRLNLSLRTAQRILYLLDAFPAGQAQDLYRRLVKLPWERFIAADGYLSVTSSVKTDAVNDTRFANVKTKDAIVDRIREKQGRRPDSGPGRQGAVVHLHWEGDRCEVWLDTSGEPLSRRGYRKIPLEAPMQETLAAAVVLATGWDGTVPLVNPMCGSGTLAIEGALIALGRAPGILRQNFGFMHILGFDRPAFERQRDLLKKAARRKGDGRIVATDIRPEAVEAARQNARTAGVEHLIEFGAEVFACFAGHFAHETRQGLRVVLVQVAQRARVSQIVQVQLVPIVLLSPFHQLVIKSIREEDSLVCRRELPFGQDDSEP